jgi:hypothetical protein
MAAVKAANLGLAFVLELCGLAAVAKWGYQAGEGWQRIALAIAAPLGMAVIWGVFISPNAVITLPATLKFFLGAAILLLTAAALASAGQPVPAAIFATVIVLNNGLIAVWQQ